MANQTITVRGLQIVIERINSEDFISLTDIAKQSTEEPRYVIQNWMKNTNTIRYLYLWEQFHNPDENRIQMDAVLKTATDNRVIISPKTWIETVGAIGMKWKTGRGGGTFAHKDILLLAES